ncbi:unannotated protein [freshwater metagenome]|uniref:16S rRNA (uracil(1498)-N(3))-methyltransferase n=1 Tax=freshwater metagenome TaxID=449393 RepID=A0A6J7XU86_9ZZZZ|nr:16S rRNA (uracil(1498)-N(3))-methyltransferase [Actinomycetota bacterium]
MLTQFFVSDLPILVGQKYEFDSQDSNHAIKVLRIETGEIFRLSDGAGLWSDIIVEDVKKKSMAVRVLSTGYEEPLDVKFTVLQAIPKGDRLKEAVELMTEGGVDEIILWKSARTISRPDKVIEKLELTAREACKQSRRTRIPRLREAVTTNQVVPLLKNYDLVLIFHESATMKISEVVTQEKNVLLIIGPEGGITDEEIALFEKEGARIVVMGRPILRSAHAGLAALSAVNALLGVW